ncbi:hypothetical protein NA57DRAFT_55286 [Rhizodiscina lignyota]|uniref:Bromodomain associated domain-containing protein n=1 Tax=Rhizodiscina lignyota TaxID=1504668 RepID=A0A9P4IEB0_9PEZI|nr:hypothetical protein NA57DRAFT_55286 [Rhizodiscina lignyota]
MDTRKFHNALLRPAVLQILRAAGFQSARPFAVDALTDITSLYLRQLAQRTAEHAIAHHGDLIADVTDVRMAMNDCAVFAPILTPTEEAWKEVLRKPLEEYHENARAQEQRSRDEEDTREIKEFIEWVRGDVNKEIARIAGLVADANTVIAPEPSNLKDDYVTALKKKHSKTGEESRFQGSVLGIQAEDRAVKVEGGSVDSLQEWNEWAAQRASKLAIVEAGNGYEAEMIDEDHDKDQIMSEG